jgi:hypothetical protein
MSPALHDLTLKGAFVSEPVQRFQGSVSVKFQGADSANTTKLQEVYVEWWDDEADDTHDCSAAFTSALNAMKTSGRIALRLLARPYRASAVIPAPTNAVYPICIFGSGDGSVIRTNSASSPALSLDLGISDPNTTVLLLDFALGGRGAQSAPVLSLKAQGGTTNRLYGMVDVKAVGSGFLSDCVYLKGGLKVDVNVRTEEGRYALYLDGCSNTFVKLHAGNATCNGVMINGGANSSIHLARVEDSSTANTRAVSTISGNGSTVTVTTTTAHGLESMDRVTVSGASGFSFTSPRRVTVVSSTVFTYAGSETSGSGGTVRISSSVVRIRDSQYNQFFNVANEGKDGIDYCIWIQSTGSGPSSDPSASFNKFFGGSYGPSASTARDDLAVLLIEGNSHCNEGYGIGLGKASGIKNTHWDVLLDTNDAGIKPRLNRFVGNVHLGTGNTGTIRTSDPSGGAAGNYVELSERVAEKTHTAFDRREFTSSVPIDQLMCGSTLTNRAAGAIVTVTLFASFAGQKIIRAVNNNSTYAFRLKPATGEKFLGGGTNKYLEIPVNGSATFSCSTAGELEIVASSGALTFEP